MNSWKKILTSLPAVLVGLAMGSLLVAMEERGAPCELYAYLDAAWIPSNEAGLKKKAEGLSKLRSCVDEGQKAFELDLTEMDSDQHIKLDSVQHLTGLRVLKCPGPKTTRLVLPPKLPENLEELDFSASRLYRYPLEMIEEPFLHSKNLQKLKLSKCDFLQEADRALFISPTVEELDLSGNDLRAFFEKDQNVVGSVLAKGLLVVDQEKRRAIASSFSELGEKYGSGYLERISESLGLKKLILRDCQLGQEPILAGLPGSLEELNLVDSDLRALPVGLPASLKKLNLRYNNFARVGAEAWAALFDQVPNLEELNLVNSDLRALPVGLPASLKKLNLWRNNFAQVGAESWVALFTQLPNLEELDLGGCHLAALPVGLPASLKKLTLRGNDSWQVGAQALMALFAQLPQLEELDLRDCSLAAFPSGLPASLKRLMLGWNNFAQVGAQAWAALFDQVPNLEELNLDHCSLTAFPSGLPASLKRLMLGWNNFAQVGAQAWAALFAQLPHLEELDLQGCGLRALPIGLPASLKKLLLSWNNFAQVGAEAWAALFAQLPHLEELDLQGCGLSARPADLPAGLVVRLRFSLKKPSGVSR